MDATREYLGSVRAARRQIAACKDRLLGIRTQAERITATFGPKSSGDREALLAALADASGECLKKEMRAEQLIADVSRFIDRIEDGDEQVILRLRYVECLEWDEVGNELPKRGVYVSNRTMFRLHGSALESARRIMRGKPNGETGKNGEF